MHAKDRTIITDLSAGGSVALELARDIRTGLLVDGQKSLPPKYFYDGPGSALFEKITALEEYYPTRAETEILQRIADDVVGQVAPSELVELGSGSSAKTRLLLEAMHRAGGHTYVPFDVSRDALESAARELTEQYPWLHVRGFIGDFHTDLHRIDGNGGRRLVAFLGSTIGNFLAPRRHALLTEVRRLLRPGDRFLLGADLVKDPAVLVAAYDDAAGVTAEFNRNMLRNVNRLSGSDFDPDDFDHRAVWNPELSCIEMWLVARRELTVSFPTLGATMSLEEGEHIRTEYSCKFRRAELTAELAKASLTVQEFETDDDGRFALALVRPA